MTPHITLVWNSALLLVIAFSPSARAAVTYIETEDKSARSLTIIRMTVTPAAEPTPALKHRLIARDIDLKSGNAAPYYYRAIFQSSKTMERARKEFGDDFDTWYTTGGDAMAIADLPLDKVRKAAEMTADPIEYALAEAVSRRNCDWQLGIEELRGIEIVAFRLPEFNDSRELGRILALRTRLAIADQRFDDAIDGLRMNYRLGRDVSQPPFLVCGLIGIAISQIASGNAVELIAAPNSPNLYWALTELPDPLVNMREAANFELDFGPRMFPFIHHAETTHRSPEEWNRLFTQALRDLHQAGGGGLFGEVPAIENDAAAGLVATGVALLGYPHAKQQLIAQGMDRARVEAMAVGQVMAIYTEVNYRHYADEYQKLWYMPFWEMQQRAEPIEHELSGADLLSGRKNRELLPLVSLLLPAMQAARSAQFRMERDIAALRVIEALRMYAAPHEGKLPDSLDQIMQVPIPLNPATGKPFQYRVDGATAILELPHSDGIRGYNRRFEIQIAKSEK